MGNRRIRREHGPFSEETIGKRQRKKLIKESQADKDRFVTPGSVADMKQLLAFQKEIDRMNVDMVEFHGRGKAWLKEHAEKGGKGTSFQAFNDMFQRRMLMMCILPLQRGINAESLVQSVGMAVGMAIVNPDFRKNLHQAYANWQINRHGGINEYILDMENDPKAIASIDKHLAKANGGRIPFTEQSAAAMNIALAKQAYEGFRNPEMDDFDVGYAYQNAQEMLYKLAKADGISEDALDRATRVMYGRLSQVDPSLSQLYSETAYRKVVMGDMEDDEYKTFDEDGNSVIRKRYVWNGAYGDVESQQDFEGMFHVREKMDVHEFGKTIQEDMAEHLRWVKPKDFAKSGNAFFVGMMQAHGYEIPKDFPYQEKMANHMSDYFAMGAYDGIAPIGDFDSIPESLSYYQKTGDESRMGMVDRYCATMQEVIDAYAAQGSEYAEAVTSWQKDVHDFGNDFTQEKEAKANPSSTSSKRRPARDTIDYGYGNEADDDFSYGERRY